jgi:hypothetical protein
MSATPIKIKEIKRKNPAVLWDFSFFYQKMSFYEIFIPEMSIFLLFFYKNYLFLVVFCDKIVVCISMQNYCCDAKQTTLEAA